ncbi:MAG: transcriptional regulator [Betaproteobacteria bacterium]|nr:transcriptional regulator [Betaproteobacteria bacterium]
MAQAIVADLDRLPDDAWVKVRVIAKLRSCHVSTIWRDVKNGRFEKPFKTTANNAAWRVGTVRQALRRTA